MTQVLVRKPPPFGTAEPDAGDWGQPDGPD